MTPLDIQEKSQDCTLIYLLTPLPTVRMSGLPQKWIATNWTSWTLRSHYAPPLPPWKRTRNNHPKTHYQETPLSAGACPVGGTLEHKALFSLRHRAGWVGIFKSLPTWMLIQLFWNFSIIIIFLTIWLRIWSSLAFLVSSSEIFPSFSPSGAISSWDQILVFHDMLPRTSSRSWALDSRT